MHVFKEARHKGDTATMEYVWVIFLTRRRIIRQKLTKDAREKVKLQRVEAVQKRREEREKKRQFLQNKVQTFQLLFKLDILLKQPGILSLFVAV